MAEAAELVEKLAEALTETPTRHEVLTENYEKIKAAQPTEEAPKIERTRAPDGKFAAEDKVAAPKAATAAPGITTPPVDPLAQPEPVWKKPPNSWKKDYHEAWTKADPRLQEYAFQREEQMKAGVEPLKAKAAFADSVQQVLEPFMPTIRGLGYEAPQVIKGLLEADRILRSSPPQEKLAYLVQIAQNYGVDLQALTGAASQVAPVNPDYHALRNELLSVKGQMQGWFDSQKQTESQTMQDMIDKFASADGHEHYETVKPVMAALLQSGQAKDLDEAYKKAVRLDDTLFESEVQARQAKTIEDKDKAAKSARAAAVSVRGSTPGSHTATKADTRRDMLREGLRAMDSRV